MIYLYPELQEVIALKKQGRHDCLCAMVADILADKGYSPIIVNKEYSSIEGKHGEVDVYAMREVNNLLYIINVEVKCRHTDGNEHHARGQLRRSADYFFRMYDRVFNFYVAPKANNSNSLVWRWEK